jgi:WD40 repeat protein
LAISPDGTVASGSQDGLLTTWESGKARSTDMRASEIWSLAFSPDGKKLAVGADKCVAVVSTADHRVTWRKNWDVLSVNVAFSPNADKLAVTRHVQNGHNGAVELLNVSDGRTEKTLSSDDTELSYVRFSGVNRVVASGREGIYFWDPTSGDLVKTLKLPGGATFAMSPQEDLIAVAGFNGCVVVAAAEDGNVIQRINLRGGGYSSYPCAFNRDGRTLATGFGGTTLWDSRTGQFLRKLTDELTCGLAFSPDGKSLVASLNNGKVEDWPIGQEPLPSLRDAEDLGVHNVVVTQDTGNWKLPHTIFAVAASDARAPASEAYYRATTQPAATNPAALIGFSDINGVYRKGGIHVIEAKATSFRRTGNEIFVRVAFTYDYSNGMSAPSEYWYVTTPLPPHVPGLYRCTIAFDEYKDGKYFKPAAETVFNTFIVR